MSLDLLKKVEKRRDEVLQKKQADQAQIKKLQNEIQRHSNKQPKRSRDTCASLDKKIDELERERTITSIPLAREREILKQIHSIKKKKIEIEEYHGIEKLIQEKKTIINDLRDGMKTYNTSLSEIEAALAKIKLANKLGCSTQEVTKVQIPCPAEKLGVVIGKNGSMIKSLEKNAKVNLEINKENMTIEIEGSQASIDMAKAEIDKLIRSTELEVDVPRKLLGYLAEKHVNVIPELREANEDVTIDIIRSSGRLTLAGLPERVDEVKNTILGLDIVTKERHLEGKELPVVIGKKGSTIGELVVKHKISIDLEKSRPDSGIAFVTGPPSLVDETLQEIDNLINDNREVTESIHVTTVLQKILLDSSGKGIKTVQRRVNQSLKEFESNNYCSLSFDMDNPDKTDSLLVVKAKQPILSSAVDLTKAELELYDGLVISIDVDPYVIPRIIGKSGDNIKKLTQGKACFVEVSRSSGEISLGGSTTGELNGLKEGMEQMISDNSIARVAADPEIMRAQFRELVRTKTRNELNALQVRVDLDNKNSSFILCGKKENLEQAKTLLEEYLVNTFVDEMTVTGNDMTDLLSGGKGCMIQRLSNELKVNLHAERERNVIIIKGEKENVVASKQRLDQFLNGGNGHSVAKVVITENIVGAIIGKGGKNRQQLEKKYGVSVHISEANFVTIRGPEEKVVECKLEIMKMVSTARVTQTLSVTEEQEKSLEQSGTLKRIMRDLPGTQISIADGTASVRGYFYDVCDAVALLNEKLLGEYKTFIELDTSQFAKVSATARDPSHFERMQAASDAKVSLDSDAGFIVISGKRSNVKKAKDHVFGFLSFVLPGEIHRLELSKPLYSSVGQANSLAEVAALSGGPTIYLDRDLGCIIIRSTDSESNKRASSLVQERLKEAEKLIFVLEVTPADSWLLSLIVGKNGSRISMLETDSGCKVDVSRESRTITVRGETEEQVAKMRESITEIIEKARRENVFISFPEPAIASFIGKGASHLKGLSEKHGVEIQRIRRGPHPFKISGDESKIEATQEAIQEWLSNWEESRASLQIPIQKQFIPAIIGSKAETVKSIQEEFGCRVDIDRKEFTIAIRGGNKTKREGALEKIEAIIAKEKEAKIEILAQRKENGLAHQPPKSEPTQLLPAGSSEPTEEDRKPLVKDFPAFPVGVKAPGPKKQKGKNAVEQGTEMGHSLFNLLVSGPVDENDGQ